MRSLFGAPHRGSGGARIRSSTRDVVPECGIISRLEQATRYITERYRRGGTSYVFAFDVPLRRTMDSNNKAQRATNNEQRLTRLRSGGDGTECEPKAGGAAALVIVTGRCILTECDAARAIRHLVGDCSWGHCGM